MRSYRSVWTTCGVHDRAPPHDEQSGGVGRRSTDGAWSRWAGAACAKGRRRPPLSRLAQCGGWLLFLVPQSERAGQAECKAAGEQRRLASSVVKSATGDRRI
eukprot:1801490-Prymnesium_polylepis.1